MPTLQNIFILHSQESNNGAFIFDFKHSAHTHLGVDPICLLFAF